MLQTGCSGQLHRSSVRLLQTEQRQERKQRPPAAFNVQGFCWRRVRQVVIVKLDIFFPASGNYNGTSLNNRGSNGNYWSSSYNSATNAYNLNFNSSNVNPANNNNNRRYGFTARAVQLLPGTRYDTGNRTT